VPACVYDMPGCAYAGTVLVRLQQRLPIWSTHSKSRKVWPVRQATSVSADICERKSFSARSSIHQQAHVLTSQTQNSMVDEEAFVPIASESLYFLSARAGEEFDSKGLFSTTRLKDIKTCRSSNEDHWRGCKYRRQVNTTEISVDPWKVMFSKPSICDRFSCGRSIAATIQALQKGDVCVADIPKITVIQQGGCFITLDHRRLYCFRAALPKGTAIPVILLKTRWLANRSIEPNARMYSAVRVERDYLKQGERECVWY